jgi:hypothetical protein
MILGLPAIEACNELLRQLLIQRALYITCGYIFTG